MAERVVIIAGPTCSGKTELSLLLAKSLPVEIISADSRQIYKQLNIGTAKPNRKERASVKHHFIDICEPQEDYDVSLFEAQALETIDDITERVNIPLVVGGSGLYIKAITEGIFTTVDRDEKYREYLHKVMEEEGTGGLYEMLARVDVKAAETMLPQNWKRVMRALEVFKLSGKSILEHHKEYVRERKIESLTYCLNPERENLYKDIEERVDRMFEQGLLEEIKGVLNNGVLPDTNALNTVGYKETIAYLNGEYTLERAKELIKRNTRRYAKRQMTWFRNNGSFTMINMDSRADIPDIAEQLSSNIKKYFE